MKTFPKRWTLLPLIAFVTLGVHTGLADDEGRRDAVERFATLPDGVRFPEGITANPANGEIYVGTFDFGPNANKLLRFSHNGRLIAQRDFGATPLLGLAFHAATGKVYIANFGAGKIQRISANFFAATPIEDVAILPHIGPPPPRKDFHPLAPTASRSTATEPRFSSRTRAMTACSNSTSRRTPLPSSQRASTAPTASPSTSTAVYGSRLIRTMSSSR